MLLRRAGLTASAGLSCLVWLQKSIFLFKKEIDLFHVFCHSLLVIILYSTTVECGNRTNFKNCNYILYCKQTIHILA